MRLQDADIDRDNMKWDVECDECHEHVRWVGTVKLKGLRVLDSGKLGLAVVRVCRKCALRSILLPERKPIRNEQEMSQPYVRPVDHDPHDIEEKTYGTPPDTPPPTAA